MSVMPHTRQMMPKLALGTAQFGMAYGINNKRGKIPEPEVYEILTHALKYGIDTFDTACAYGRSEELLGNFVDTRKCELKIISKLPECKYDQVENIVDRSLVKLRTPVVYGYLVHSFKGYAADNRIYAELNRLKYSGKIKKTGFSVYFPEELEYLFENNENFDIVQLPYNIFDRRFADYFPELKKRGVELYARSVFLQGLVFKDPKKLTGGFTKIKSKIELLNKIAEESGAPVFAICLGFVMLNQHIDKTVVGVDSIENFKELLSYTDYAGAMSALRPELAAIAENDESVILPVNWQ
jgi:aryl-alcohol dehydrogenase-like predicted oxidoreductase